MMKSVHLFLQAGVTSSSLSRGYMPCEPATSYYCLTGTKHPLTTDSAAFTGSVVAVKMACILLLKIR